MMEYVFIKMVNVIKNHAQLVLILIILIVINICLQEQSVQWILQVMVVLNWLHVLAIKKSNSVLSVICKRLAFGQMIVVKKRNAFWIPVPQLMNNVNLLWIIVL